MVTLVIAAVVTAAVGLLLFTLRRRSNRAEGVADERQLGNHYVGGEVHQNPPGQGWGGGPS